MVTNKRRREKNVKKKHKRCWKQKEWMSKQKEKSRISKKQSFAGGNSSMVEQSTHDHVFEGLNPA
jgi:hypothetical protein